MKSKVSGPRFPRFAQHESCGLRQGLLLGKRQFHPDIACSHVCAPHFDATEHWLRTHMTARPARHSKPTRACPTAGGSGLRPVFTLAKGFPSAPCRG